MSSLLTGAEVRENRKRLKLNQDQLGKKIGRSGQWVSSIENCTKFAAMNNEMDRRLKFLFKLDGDKTSTPPLTEHKTVVMPRPIVRLKQPVKNAMLPDVIKEFELDVKRIQAKIDVEESRAKEIEEELEESYSKTEQLKKKLCSISVAVEAMKR